MIQITPMRAAVYDREITKETTNKIALIDADRYKHLVAYRMYKKINDEGFVRSKELLNEIIEDYLLRDIFSCFSAKAYVFCFSAPSKKVFRNAITQEKKYKGSREGKVDNYFYDGKFEDMAYVFEYIKLRYQTLFFDDLEADDILSFLQNKHTFIFSHDKDLIQVPGTHWDIENYKFIEITEVQGTTTLVLQVLLGDSIDSIPGLKGFGKKAQDTFIEKVLDENMSVAQILFYAMTLYTNKLGVKVGFDTFVEMWSLVSLKIDRGDYFKEKYAKAYITINSLIEKE